MLGAERILTVDGDLGNSDRDAHSRDARGRHSHKQPVARVCLNEIGAVFGLEVGRLGRLGRLGR
jgi:hypothetical protein